VKKIAPGPDRPTIVKDILGCSSAYIKAPSTPKLSLSAQILIGIAAGLFMGIFFGEKMACMKIWGDVYIKLLAGHGSPLHSRLPHGQLGQIVI